MFTLVNSFGNNNKRYGNKATQNFFLNESSPVKTNTCFCDGHNDNGANTIAQKSLVPIEQTDQIHLTKKDSCPSCLYVGVATCTGLAIYFGSIAFEKPLNPEMAATAARHKPVFLAISVGWVCVGMYRIYLG